MAHQVCKVCSKQRDDALKAGADLAHSLSAANYVTEEAVNRYAVADQTAKAALKESEVLAVVIALVAIFIKEALGVTVGFCVFGTVFWVL